MRTYSPYRIVGGKPGRAVAFTMRQGNFAFDVSGNGLVPSEVASEEVSMVRSGAPLAAVEYHSEIASERSASSILRMSGRPDSRRTVR